MQSTTTTSVLITETFDIQESENPWKIVVRRFIRRPGAMMGLFIVILMILLASFSALIAPYNPIKMVPSDTLQSPNRDHIMGTDIYGRDVFSRIVYGARYSLQIGLISVLIGASIGVVLGFVSGYLGGTVDEFIMRIMDIMLAFPGILLALTLVAFLGASLGNLIIALGISSIPQYTRLVRGTVLSAKNNLHVEAARALGTSTFRIAIWHILPSILSPLIVVATLGIAWAIMNGAALSFLGLGAKPPTPEWGIMLSEGRDYLRIAPWISTFPGLAIMLLVIGINLVGDGLRVSLDPRMRR